MSRRAHPGAALVLAGVLATLGGTPSQAAPLDAEAILPPADHAAGEARVLAEAHGRELRALLRDLGRCLPAVAVDRHGIAFRRPRGTPAAPPHLTVWVWLPPDAASGPDPAARAGKAFRGYGRALIMRLLARSPILTDDRVGGYGLVLSWLGPGTRGGRPIAESLVLFADKIAATNFALDTIGPTAFLQRADVRLFDGQTELSGARPAVTDDDPAVVEPC